MVDGPHRLIIRVKDQDGAEGVEGIPSHVHNGRGILVAKRRRVGRLPPIQLTKPATKLLTATNGLNIETRVRSWRALSFSRLLAANSRQSRPLSGYPIAAVEDSCWRRLEIDPPWSYLPI